MLCASVGAIDAAIQYVKGVAPNRRHKSHEGRRLIQEGQFQYCIPSWVDYQEIKNEQDRREYNRIKQAEYRARKKQVNGKPLAGEQAYLRTGETPHEHQ